MLQMNDWMRLWGLDPKTGWPVIWSVWWPWTQSISVSKTHIEVNIEAGLPNMESVEFVEKPMIKVEAVPEMALEESETQIGLAVAPTEEPVKKTVSRKRAPKANNIQAPLDLEVQAVKPKSVAKTTRAKNKPIAAITPVISEPILPAKKTKAVIEEVLMQDEPKKLEAPVLMEVDEASDVENVVKLSVEQAQNVAQQVVAESTLIEK